jgi:2,4-dienoyl-CoA reductase-like NADH-dependent reductase (Old Yellow Enzyme family)
MTERGFKHIFSPFKIGKCEISNRLAVPAMVTNYCDEDGNTTDRYIAYHEEKAKGGWGLIISEDFPVNEHAMGYKFVAGM